MEPVEQTKKSNVLMLLSIFVMAILVVSVFFFSNQNQKEQISETRAALPSASSGGSSPVLIAPAVIIDYHNVDASVIPQTYLALAQQKNLVFDHHSVGTNIMAGMATLQGQNSTRYGFVSQWAPPPDWFTTHHNTGINIGEFSDGTNGYPQEKIDGFNTTMRGGLGNLANLAFMKFCFTDIYDGDQVHSGLTNWTSYKNMMLSLIATYPNTKFIWFTMPLENASPNFNSDNHQKGVFNNYVRQYVQTNGGTLFDLASVESHDPNGNPVVDRNGDEGLWAGTGPNYDNGYAVQGDNHLQGSGQVRMANTMWWMLAREAGWSGSGTQPTATPTPIIWPTRPLDQNLGASDITNDHKVTISDFNLQHRYIGTVCASTDYNCMRADINCSKNVNVSDASIMSTNFSLTVPTLTPLPPPPCAYYVTPTP